MVYNYLHLVLAHIPVLGIALTFFLLIFANKNDNKNFFKIEFFCFMVVAVSTALTYFFGGSAYDYVKESVPSIENNALETHALLGKISLFAILLLAAMQISLFRIYIVEQRPAIFLRKFTIVVTFVVMILVFVTAHYGGFIRRIDLQTLLSF